MGALRCDAEPRWQKQEGALKYRQALGMSRWVLVGQDQEMALWVEASSHPALPSSIPTQSSSLSSAPLVCVCAINPGFRLV